MKKLLAIFMLFVLCGACLLGCGQTNKFDKKIEKVLKKTKEYVNECDIKDFYHIYDLLNDSGEKISISYYKEQLYSRGQPLNSDEYSKEFQDELLQFFQKYPGMGGIYSYIENGLLFWHRSLQSDIIICENEEPIPWVGPDDYVRKETEGTIYWISDHRKDNESYYRHMYYEFGFQKLDETLWVGYHFEKYPWYSIFIE